MKGEQLSVVMIWRQVKQRLLSWYSPFQTWDSGYRVKSGQLEQRWKVG